MSLVLHSLRRSKFLWLHSLFAFLYFLINLAFMGHHCLGFVPKKSLHVSVWRTLSPASQKDHLGSSCMQEGGVCLQQEPAPGCLARGCFPLHFPLL